MSIKALSRAPAPVTGGVDLDVVRTTNGRTFQERVLNAKGPVAVEFMSYGCRNCRLAEDEVQQVAESLNGQEAVYRVNVGTDPQLKAAYDIRITPTFVMFHNGREVARVENPKPSFENLLAVVTFPFRS